MRLPRMPWTIIRELRRQAVRQAVLAQRQRGEDLAALEAAQADATRQRQLRDEARGIADELLHERNDAVQAYKDLDAWCVRQGEDFAAAKVELEREAVVARGAYEAVAAELDATRATLASLQAAYDRIVIDPEDNPALVDVLIAGIDVPKWTPDLEAALHFAEFNLGALGVDDCTPEAVAPVSPPVLVGVPLEANGVYAVKVVPRPPVRRDYPAKKRATHRKGGRR